MSDPNGQTKRHQVVLIGCSLGGILALSLIGMFYFDSAPTTTQGRPQTVNITAPGSIDDKDAWRAQQSAKEKSNETQINEIRTELKQQQDAAAKLSLELEAVKSERSKSGAGTMTPSRMDQQILEQPLPPVPRSFTGDSRATPPLTMPANGKPAGLAAPLNTPLDQIPGAVPAPRELEILRFDAGSSTRTSIKANEDGKVEVLGFPVEERAKQYGSTKAGNANEAGGQSQIEFLPAGSFVRVSMLNGVDAPTGGQAQSNPLPLALHVLDSANLANKYRLNIKDCRFIAAAWGDLSAERTMARSESLTCIINGKSVEMAVKGQVIGEDGKAGIRGRVVTKQGQLLANALFAGSLSGIGKAFQAAATTTTSNAAGMTQVIEADKVAQAGIGSGVSAAANSLAQYYLRAADKLFPVIETDGGRIVEVLITKGAVYSGSGALRDESHALLSRSGFHSRRNDDD